MKYFIKWFLALGDSFAANSDWKDFALTKFCLCSMGVLIGTYIPKKKKKNAQIASAFVFGATYALLMRKVFLIIKEMRS